MSLEVLVLMGNLTVLFCVYAYASLFLFISLLTTFFTYHSQPTLPIPINLTFSFLKANLIYCPQLTYQQLGPGLMEMHGTCTACGGSGRTIAERDRCAACKGNCTVNDTKITRVSWSEVGSEQDKKSTIHAM